MSNPMIFWYGLVGALLLLFLAQFLHYLHVQSRRKNTSGHRIVTQSTEHDMLFIPGDQAFDDDCDEDYLC